MGSLHFSLVDTRAVVNTCVLAVTYHKARQCH